MKINPSSEAHLDCGHDSTNDSRDNQQDQNKKGKNYQLIIPHDERDPSRLKKLAARKARRKKKKIVERKARKKQKEDDKNTD